MGPDPISGVLIRRDTEIQTHIERRQPSKDRQKLQLKAKKHHRCWQPPETRKRQGRIVS